MTLGDFMKSKEEALRTYLPKKKWYMLRLDGKAFSKFCRQFEKPFDDKFIDSMNEVAKYLCANIQGSKMAFIQSDEISILFTDIGEENTQSWFDGAVLKIVSVSASMASAKFNAILPTDGLALFDSRILVLEDLKEVKDYFKWRQEDCTKNSVSMVASHYYSHKELHKVNTEDKLLMIQSKGDDWTQYEQGKRQGRVVLKEKVLGEAKNPKTGEVVSCERTIWKALPAPILSESNFEALLSL